MGTVFWHVWNVVLDLHIAKDCQQIRGSHNVLLHQVWRKMSKGRTPIWEPCLFFGRLWWDCQLGYYFLYIFACAHGGRWTWQAVEMRTLPVTGASNLWFILITIDFKMTACHIVILYSTFNNNFNCTCFGTCHGSSQHIHWKGTSTGGVDTLCCEDTVKWVDNAVTPFQGDITDIYIGCARAVGQSSRQVEPNFIILEVFYPGTGM